MAEKKTTPVLIDDVEYNLEDMTKEQQLYVRHVADLDRKIGSAQFNIEQMQIGRNGFMELLKQSLESPAEDVAAE
jgi:hypothetical protein